MKHATPPSQAKTGAGRHDSHRPFSDAVDRLKAAGLRPTRQRMALCRLLFEPGHRHITAEALHVEAEAAGVSVSLATIYNTLNQFTEAGLLRQVVIEAGRAWFDTNVDDHHHFFIEGEGGLEDIPGNAIEVLGIPVAPPGTELTRVDVVVRVRRTDGGSGGVV